MEIMIWTDKRRWVAGGAGAGKLGITPGLKATYKTRALELKRRPGGVRKGLHHPGPSHFSPIRTGRLVLIRYLLSRGPDMI